LRANERPAPSFTAGPQLRRFYTTRKVDMQETSVCEVLPAVGDKSPTAQREMPHAGTGCTRVHDAERHRDARSRCSHRVRLLASERLYDGGAAGCGRRRRTVL